MKKIALTLLFLPLLAFAETAGELTVGEQIISYDSSTQIESGVLYYAGDSLVASEHGTFMLVYQDDRVVLEAHDISGDGEHDTFLTLNENDEITKIEGEGANAFERQQPVTFEELVAGDSEGAGFAGAPEEDLVGPLDSISITGSGSSIWFFIFLVIFAVSSWWYFSKREKDDE